MKNKSSLHSTLKSVVKKNRTLSALLFLIILLSVVFSLLPPLVLAGIINRLTAGKADVLMPALLYFLLLVLSGVTDSGKEVLITVFGQKITHMLRSRMLEKLPLLPADYFTKNTSGQIASRFVNDVDTVEELFTDGVIGMFTDICQVLGILVVIWIKSVGLGILITLAAPLLFLLTRSFQKKMLVSQMSVRRATAKINGHIPETIRTIRMIHSFGKEDYMEKRYNNGITEQYSASDQTNFYDSVYSPLIILISTLVIAVMMVLASAGSGIRVLFGIDAGTAVAIIAYVGKVFDPLEDIGMEIQSIQSAVAGKKRIDEFLDEPEKAETDPSVKADNLIKSNAPCVELSNLTFGYDSEKPVLKNLSLVIRQKENITLTGRTGIGKSTVFRLILGLYLPQDGRISVFGVPASRIPDIEKRKLFGSVEQNLPVVDGTVSDQISLHDPALTKEQIENAAKLAGVHEIILTLEKGYDTPFRKELFSQGQLQLLSVARAIVSDPPILLLDEITANLDSATEKKIMNALSRASENRTVLSISHRSGAETGSRIISLSSL